MVHLLTQAPVIVSNNYAHFCMREHLVFSPTLPTRSLVGQVRPRTRLEIRLGLTLPKARATPPLANSDHNGLHLLLKWKPTHRQFKLSQRLIWDYKHADFTKACDLIRITDWDSLLHENDIDTSTRNWQKRFLEIMSECIPQRQLPRRHNLPWLNQNIVRCIHKRNIAFRKHKKSPNCNTAKRYQMLRNTVTSMIRKSRRAYFNTLSSTNKKQFWKAIKCLSKQKSTIPTLMLNDVSASTNSAKAKMLNDFFSSCFNPAVPPLLESLNDCPSNHCPDDFLCCEEEVAALIRSLDVSKASGPGGISSRMLKGTLESIVPSLTKLFNISIRTGKFPQCWKESSIVPIPKGGDSSKPGNYRPISLLSIMSKLLERHFHWLLTDHFNTSYQLALNQWGFQHGKSAVASLLTVVHAWLQVLETGKEILAIFYDLRKAFDSVPHVPLLQKLEATGLHPHILKWVRSYLTRRFQKVVVGGESSAPLPVLSGVPQGSVLGPLLFLIYINDAASLPFSSGTYINLFADDMLLYRGLNSPGDTQHLQQDNDLLNTWVHTHHLTMNPSKCKYMRVSRKRKPTDVPAILLEGIPLECVDTIKYLGVILSSDLSWTPHIESVCTKARKLLGLLYRRFYNSAGSDTLFELYTTQIRPHLEYAAPVWDPCTARSIKKLENTQKPALKICSKQWDNLGYQDLLDLAKCPTLRNCRLYFKLCTLYKIVHKLIYFPVDILPLRSNLSAPVPLLNQPFARTNSFFSSFVLSSISLWNNLPHEALTADSIHSFKSSLCPLFICP